MKKETATYALGCFWGPDDYFSKLPGVIKTTVGYTGSTNKNPTYNNLGDHTEAVEIEFNPDKISYEDLLEKFFMYHDPTFTQITQYRSTIFFHNNDQKRLAREAKKKSQEQHKGEILTSIETAGKFWPAEEYHQKYFQKHNISGVC